MLDPNDLIGRWRLVSWKSIDDEGRVTHPFGDSPRGVFVCLADGWAAVQIAASSRPQSPAAGALAGSESERAAAFSSYFAYAGRYEVREDTVALTVELSLYPQMVGSEQVRHVVFRDGDLVLRTPPVPFGERVATHELRWTRDS